MENYNIIDNINNVTEQLIDNFIEQILEDNYREVGGEISDIRYSFYGDVNKFYDYYDNKEHILPIKLYVHTLSDCIYEYLEKEIKKIIDPYVYYLKISNCMPHSYLWSIVPLFNWKYNFEQRLCIYYDGCHIKDNLIEFHIGLDSIGLYDKW